MGLHVMPGERLELQVRTPPAAVAGRYAACLAYPALALLAWLAFQSAWWQARTPGAWWQAWRHLYGTWYAADLWVAVALLACGAAWAAASGRRGPLIVGAASAAAAVVGAHLAGGTLAHETRLALATVALVAPALLAVELDRRLRVVWLTNLRTAASAGLFGQEVSVLHDLVRDLEVRQGPLQRLVGSGHLAFVLAAQVPDADADADAPPGKAAKGRKRRRRKAAVPVMEQAEVGPLHPVAKVHRLVQLLIRDITGSEFLRKAEDLERRKHEAKADLHGALRAHER